MQRNTYQLLNHTTQRWLAQTTLSADNVTMTWNSFGAIELLWCY